MFTSDGVRSTRTFGYTYPELVDWDISPDELAANVRNEINRLYNIGTSNVQRQRTVNSRRSADITVSFSHITFDMAKEWGVNNLEMQWSIQLRLDRFAYNKTFAIHFFMGVPPKDARSWPTAPNLVGTHAQFIGANNARWNAGASTSGSQRGEVSLTHTLAAGVARGMLADMDPESVVPLLSSALTWRASSPDGCEIDVDLLSGLSVAVVSRPLKPISSPYDFPIYGKLRWHPEVTKGKPGGAQQWYRLTY